MKFFFESKYERDLFVAAIVQSGMVVQAQIGDSTKEDGWDVAYINNIPIYARPFIETADTIFKVGFRAYKTSEDNTCSSCGYPIKTGLSFVPTCQCSK